MKSLALLGALLAGVGCAAWPLAAAAQRAEPLTLERGAGPGRRNGRHAGRAAESPCDRSARRSRGRGSAGDPGGAAAEPRSLARSREHRRVGSVFRLAVDRNYAQRRAADRAGWQARRSAGRCEGGPGRRRLREQLALADIALAVRQRYVAAVAAQARVDLAQDMVDRSRELARIATELVDAGREPPLRALSAQAQTAEAVAELKAAQANALASRFALGALWSQEPRITAERQLPGT